MKVIGLIGINEYNYFVNILSANKSSNDLFSINRITKNNVVIMSHNTWTDDLKSIPLINRTNCVISSEMLIISGAIVFTTLFDALLHFNDRIRVYIIGDAQLLNYGIVNKFIHELIITQIDTGTTTHNDASHVIYIPSNKQWIRTTGARWAIECNISYITNTFRIINNDNMQMVWTTHDILYNGNYASDRITVHGRNIYFDLRGNVFPLCTFCKCNFASTKKYALTLLNSVPNSQINDIIQKINTSRANNINSDDLTINIKTKAESTIICQYFMDILKNEISCYVFIEKCNITNMLCNSIARISLILYLIAYKTGMNVTDMHYSIGLLYINEYERYSYLNKTAYMYPKIFIKDSVNLTGSDIILVGVNKA